MKTTLSTKTMKIIKLHVQNLVFTFMLLGMLLCAHAQKSQLPEVPNWLPQERHNQLNLQRASLIKRRDTLNESITNHNRKCATFDEGSALAIECRREGREIEVEKARYLKAKEEFETKLADLVKQVVPNLAQDELLAKRNRLALEQIEGRISRLKKAIEILGDSNPAWSKEWERLRKDQIAARHQLMWTSLDLVSLGLAETFKHATKKHLDEAAKMFANQEWSELSRQKESLIKLRKTWNNPALEHWIADLERVDKARSKRDIAESVARIRDSISHGHDAYEGAKEAVASEDRMEQLYHASAALGEVAIPFVEGVAAKSAVVADAVFKGIEIGLVIKLIREEDQQFKDLSARSFDRNQKKQELMEKVKQLENDRDGLRMTIQRSEGVK